LTRCRRRPVADTDLAALIPGVTRSGHTVAFDAEAMTAAYGLLQVIVALTQNGP
jgi:D-amino peptidase